MTTEARGRAVQEDRCEAGRQRLCVIQAAQDIAHESWNSLSRSFNIMQVMGFLFTSPVGGCQ